MEEVEKTDGRKERERDERSFRTVESVGLTLLDPILGTLVALGSSHG